MIFTSILTVISQVPAITSSELDVLGIHGRHIPEYGSAVACKFDLFINSDSNDDDNNIIVVIFVIDINPFSAKPIFGRKNFFWGEIL